MGPRDVTPEATANVLEKEVNGITETLRAYRSEADSVVDAFTRYRRCERKHRDNQPTWEREGCNRITRFFIPRYPAYF